MLVIQQAKRDMSHQCITRPLYESHHYWNSDYTGLNFPDATRHMGVT